MKQKQQGFSLVELMISITIGLILMTGVVQMFLSSKQVFSTQQGISRIQETGRLAIDFLASDIRQAGYMGCLSRTTPRITNTLTNPNDYEWDFTEGIKVSTAAPTDLSPGKYKAGTHVLTIRSASGAGASILSLAGSDSSLYASLTTADGAACLSDICKDDILIVTDCAKARVFQATAIGKKNDGIEITHTGGQNAAGTWGGAAAGPGESFNVGAEVVNARTITYFISDDDGNSSLWRKEGGDPAYELLEGVEDMVFKVGMIADGVGGDAIDFNAGTDWSKVVSIEAELLVRSIDDFVASEKQTYKFANVDVTATDNRIRKVFMSTVGIRSRLQ